MIFEWQFDERQVKYGILKKKKKKKPTMTPDGNFLFPILYLIWLPEIPYFVRLQYNSFYFILCSLTLC